MTENLFLAVSARDNIFPAAPAAATMFDFKSKRVCLLNIGQNKSARAAQRTQAVSTI